MKQFHDNYGYNLQNALAKYPSKEMDFEQSRNTLMRSLEKGERASIILGTNGVGLKVFIDAAPQFKSVNFYDEGMKRVNGQTLSEKNGIGQSEKKCRGNRSRKRK